MYLMTAASGDPRGPLPNPTPVADPSAWRPRIYTPPAPRYSTWLGGAAGCRCPSRTPAPGREPGTPGGHGPAGLRHYPTRSCWSRRAPPRPSWAASPWASSRPAPYSGLDYGITFFTFRASPPASGSRCRSADRGHPVQRLPTPAMSMGTIALISLVAEAIWFLVVRADAPPARQIKPARLRGDLRIIYFGRPPTGSTTRPGHPAHRPHGASWWRGIATAPTGAAQQARPLRLALGTVVVGLIIYFPARQYLFADGGLLSTALALTAVMIGVGAEPASGRRRPPRPGRTGGRCHRLLLALLIVLDRSPVWPDDASSHIRGRPSPRPTRPPRASPVTSWTTGLDRSPTCRCPPLLDAAGAGLLLPAPGPRCLRLWARTTPRTARASKGSVQRTVVMRATPSATR
ncbi:hypothetical protein QJS66_21880 [Kocuria rhizophila]|nr:hypothetical protein QJS66_21880 [Kocuria rhizophila]